MGCHVVQQKSVQTELAPSMECLGSQQGMLGHALCSKLVSGQPHLAHWRSPFSDKAQGLSRWKAG